MIRNNLMSVENGRQMRIVAYRDFYDVPRCILAKDQGGEFWILDCAFVDEVDDYSTHYRLYPVGRDEQFAAEAMREHLAGRTGTVQCEVEVARLNFDSTKRAYFQMT